MGDRRQRIHPDRLLRHRINLPPFPEQRRIVEWLNAAAAKVAARAERAASVEAEITATLAAAFARIIVALGVRDRSRGEFWRFMRRVVSEHRDKIDDGLMFAALGYHFRKLTEVYCN